MSEAIEKLVFEGNQVRVVMQNDEPWFVGKDVCEILGYKNPAKAMNDHCKGITKRYAIMTNGGTQEVRIINEPDMYRIVCNSELPSAVKFEKWVFEEALPTIRKTGSYSVAKPTACQHAITSAPRNLAESLRMMADEYEAHELTMGVLKETATQRDEALETVKEQKSQIAWIDRQRMDMRDTVCQCAPLKDAPSENATLVRSYWKQETQKADGEFDKSQNSHYVTMIRRAIREQSMMDYELEEFKTVMKADEIKGTKHTKDECVLLEMYNAGRITISTTFIGGGEG